LGSFSFRQTPEQRGPADLRIIRERDPDRPGNLEILLCYPDSTPWCCIGSAPALALPDSSAAAGCSPSWPQPHGVEIHPGAGSAPGCSSDHGMGVVIGENLRDRQPLPPLPGA